MNRPLIAALAIAIAVPSVSSPASAYSLKRASDGGECTADGRICNVYCDNGHLAGGMNWNGSVWTDGVKSDSDKNAEARKICAADGTACS